VPPAAVRANVAQPADVLAHLLARLALDGGHARQLRGEVQQLLLRERADRRRRVDEVAGHDPGADLRADAVEGLQGALFFADLSVEDREALRFGERTLTKVASWKLTLRIGGCRGLGGMGTRASIVPFEERLGFSCC
jgi:hypothetical protein